MVVCLFFWPCAIHSLPALIIISDTNLKLGLMRDAMNAHISHNMQIVYLVMKLEAALPTELWSPLTVYCYNLLVFLATRLQFKCDGTR